MPHSFNRFCNLCIPYSGGTKIFCQPDLLFAEVVFSASFFNLWYLYKEPYWPVADLMKFLETVL